jgi:hypothetical protein
MRISGNFPNWSYKSDEIKSMSIVLTKYKHFFTCFPLERSEYFQQQDFRKDQNFPEVKFFGRRVKFMRPAILSISAERVLAPIRNAVLAHAGYGVIPVATVDSALQVLRERHVCAIVIANTVSLLDRRRVCSEGHIRHIPSVVMDPYDQTTDDQSELHVNPLDGPEVFLDALAALMQRDHQPCVAAGNLGGAAMRLT